MVEFIVIVLAIIVAQIALAIAGVALVLNERFLKWYFKNFKQMIAIFANEEFEKWCDKDKEL